MNPHEYDELLKILIFSILLSLGHHLVLEKKFFNNMLNNLIRVIFS